MKTLFVLGLMGIAFAAQASPVIYYGGDHDNITALSCQIAGPGGYDSRVYDNFTLTSAMDINGVFGNFLDFTSGSTNFLSFEVRTGVSTNNSGTLVASGTNVATRTANGSFFNYDSAVSTFTLGPGNYFLCVAVNGGTGQTYAISTAGANGVGGPLNDGNSFVDSITNGDNFKPTSFYLGTSKDFSFGLKGVQSVPEPASFAVLGLGALALVRRRRRTAK